MKVRVRVALGLVCVVLAGCAGQQSAKDNRGEGGQTRDGRRVEKTGQVCDDSVAICDAMDQGLPCTDVAGPVTVVFACDEHDRPAEQLYRMLRSTPEFACDQHPDHPPVIPDDWWYYLIGRWPIQVTGRVIAGSSGTCAIIQHLQSAQGYVTERVIALPDPATPNPQGGPSPSKIKVWRIGVATPVEVDWPAPAGKTFQYAEYTESASGAQLVLKTVQRGDDLDKWIRCVTASANTRGVNWPFPATKKH